jgi:hypothetical protein
LEDGGVPGRKLIVQEASVALLALSAASIGRKRHESVMSIVMERWVSCIRSGA